MDGSSTLTQAQESWGGGTEGSGGAQGGTDPSSAPSPLGVDCSKSLKPRSRAFPMEIRRSLALRLFQQVVCEGSKVNYIVEPNGSK